MSRTIATLLLLVAGIVVAPTNKGAQAGEWVRATCENNRRVAEEPGTLDCGPMTISARLDGAFAIIDVESRSYLPYGIGDYLLWPKDKARDLRVPLAEKLTIYKLGGPSLGIQGGLALLLQLAWVNVVPGADSVPLGDNAIPEVQRLAADILSTNNHPDCAGLTRAGGLTNSAAYVACLRDPTFGAVFEGLAISAGVALPPAWIVIAAERIWDSWDILTALAFEADVTIRFRVMDRQTGTPPAGKPPVVTPPGSIACTGPHPASVGDVITLPAGAVLRQGPGPNYPIVFVTQAPLEHRVKDIRCYGGAWWLDSSRVSYGNGNGSGWWLPDETQPPAPPTVSCDPPARGAALIGSGCQTFAAGEYPSTECDATRLVVRDAHVTIFERPNFDGNLAHADADVEDLRRLISASCSIRVEPHRDSTCIEPDGSYPAILILRDPHYARGGGCLEIPDDVSDLTPLTYERGIQSVLFLGGSQGKTKLEVFPTVGFQGEPSCVITASTALLRACGNTALSLRVIPWAPPPGSAPLDISVWPPNASAAVDGLDSTQSNGDWLVWADFNGLREVKEILVVGPAEGGHVNRATIYLGNDTVIEGIDLDSAGSRCAKIVLPTPTPMSFFAVTAQDAAGSAGWSELEAGSVSNTTFAVNCVRSITATPVPGYVPPLPKPGTCPSPDGEPLDLVISTDPARSSDGESHTESNPYVLPDGAVYRNLVIDDVGAWATIPDWTGACGGTATITVLAEARVEGFLNVSGRGYRGAPGGRYTDRGTAGEAEVGFSTTPRVCNENAGGFSESADDQGAAAANASPASAPPDAGPGVESGPNGCADASIAERGPGSGGSSPGTQSGCRTPKAGDGGGRIILIVKSLKGAGAIRADGLPGLSQFCQPGEIRAGGPGSGGDIDIRVQQTEFSGTLSAKGGPRTRGERNYVTRWSGGPAGDGWVTFLYESAFSPLPACAGACEFGQRDLAEFAPEATEPTLSVSVSVPSEVAVGETFIADVSVANPPADSVLVLRADGTPIATAPIAAEDTRFAVALTENVAKLSAEVTDDGAPIAEATAQLLVEPDPEPPSGFIAAPAVTSTLVVPITVYAHDEESGIATFALSSHDSCAGLADATWTTLPPTEVAVPAGDGVKTLRVCVKDQAGSVGELTGGTIVDTVAPQLSVGGAVEANEEVDFAFEGGDGVVKEWQGPLTEIALPQLDPGETLRLTARDLAGNQSAPLVLTGVAPQATPTAEPPTTPAPTLTPESTPESTSAPQRTPTPGPDPTREPSSTETPVAAPRVVLRVPRLVPPGTFTLRGEVRGNAQAVRVAVARRLGGRCTWLAPRGTWVSRRCSHPVWVRARLGPNSTFHRAFRLRAGRYRALAQPLSSSSRFGEPSTASFTVAGVP